MKTTDLKPRERQTLTGERVYVYDFLLEKTALSLAALAKRQGILHDAHWCTASENLFTVETTAPIL